MIKLTIEADTPEEITDLIEEIFVCEEAELIDEDELELDEDEDDEDTKGGDSDSIMILIEPED